MGEVFWVIAAGGVATLAGVFMLHRPSFLAARRRRRFALACRDFHWQREHLEARFVRLAQVHARPGSPLPADCDFADDVAYVRNRSTGELSAFVAVRIMLELPGCKREENGNVPCDGVHCEGPPCEDPCGVGGSPIELHRNEDWLRPRGGAIRRATAVFRFTDNRWQTDGRAIFNLSPSETIRFYQRDLEMMGQEPAK